MRAMKFVLLMMLWLVAGCEAVPRSEQSMPMSELKVRAPDFPAGMEWLNTDRPLSLKELRGKIVLLDFWTYCCINCMHVLPDLKKLEKKYPEELVVIGVHSAKFSGEKETENIRQAILRYEIEHPVLNDKDMTVWDHYAVNAWPTLFLIDPEGSVVGKLSGEQVYDVLDREISRLAGEYGKKGLLNKNALKFNLEKGRVPASLLSFPGKVLADEKSQRLFIADSNHNRIVVASLDGEVQEVIGAGEAGLKNGNYREAEFNHPQGMALEGDVLYVADTENHAIRRVDLKTSRVSTLAGNGRQAADMNSPWDLLVHDDQLYIAMAGPHQIWKLDPRTSRLQLHAGSGREARIDGPLQAAALAQPSGIATDGKKLYFADSEVSAIRSADLDPKGKVETIVGEDLFEFGDKDGVGPAVRLQHPLGVAYHEGSLYVADTYNNKVKKLNPAERRSVTFLGQDKGTLDEPGGLSVAGGRLYIADTNHHLIRVADLKTGQLSTLELSGVEKLALQQRPQEKFSGELIQLGSQEVKSGKGFLRMDLQLPDGFKLNDKAPSYVTLSAMGGSIQFPEGKHETTISQPSFPVGIPAQFSTGEGKLQVKLVLYYCKKAAESLCYFKKALVEVPVKVSLEAPVSEIKINYSL